MYIRKIIDFLMYSLAFLVGLSIVISLVGSVILGSMLYFFVSALVVIGAFLGREKDDEL